jgi:hypothetical protein
MTAPRLEGSEQYVRQGNEEQALHQESLGKRHIRLAPPGGARGAPRSYFPQSPIFPHHQLWLINPAGQTDIRRLSVGGRDFPYCC